MKLYRIILFVLVVLMSSTAFADYNKALDLYKKGEYLNSIYAVAEVLRLEDDSNPASDNYKLRFLAAHCHWRLENYDKAMIHFAVIRSIKPDAIEPLVDMALLSLDVGRSGKAKVYAQAVLEKDAENINALYVLGGAAFLNRNYPQAQDYYQKIISKDPEHYAAYNALGKLFMEQKKYGNAETAFSTAVALKSSSAEIYNNLAICYFRMEKFDLATENITKALTLEPNNQSIKRNQALILER